MDDGRTEDNTPFPPGGATNPSENSQILKNAGWLCGFRMDSMDGPRALANQIASYVDGAAPFVEEKDDIITQVITTSRKRESNYVHQGWSAGSIAALSPWTQSRIDATNWHNMGGNMVTRRSLVVRLRAQVLLEDLCPAPEFVAAIEEALTRPSLFEKFQAVYRALNRWGDVVPLEIEMGSSLSFTDTEANFALLPEATPFDNFNNISKIKTAHIIRKGTASNAEWSDGSWAMRDGWYIRLKGSASGTKSTLRLWSVPPSGWRSVRVGAIAPTINLLSDDLQVRLTDLYADVYSYVPAITIGPISSEHKTTDDAINASRTISSVEIRSTNHVIGLAIKYLDGVISRSGREVGGHHTFALNKGEHIIEMLTYRDDEWLRGIQFVTNTGRCSVVYGKHEGTPTISRSKGGVLVGFSTSSKKHPQHDYLITGAGGIWRYDRMPRVPKENDVYSDCYGSIVLITQSSKCFNDRGLIGNSSSMYISSVEVWSGAMIDSIQLTYTNTKGGQNSKLKTVRHGGLGGNYHRFELGNGEHIVSISGRFNEKAIVQLCFGTSKGRISEVYGGGDGQKFSASSPVGESGDAMRLQYIIGKSDKELSGIMFAWTPELP
ncbi:unnamed protein product [Rhizoctonia solani]|uniref:Jacalin-type lectin domain-containing protein n=1 Tax=Rhizoctonia solani TaxID=456999 RepID=A0A8H3E100_9AGAM|nr:unnamed protein product [Rhizoctonia solani]